MALISSAGTPARAAARRTPKPLHRLDRDIATDAADGRARPDRQRRCLGKHRLRRCEQPSIGGCHGDQRDRCREIAVDGLGADHERPRCEPTTAGDARCAAQPASARSASARAVATAASTGPIPHTRPPSAPAISCYGRWTRELPARADLLRAHGPVRRTRGRLTTASTGAPQQQRVSIKSMNHGHRRCHVVAAAPVPERGHTCARDSAFCRRGAFLRSALPFRTRHQG
jgi:hypothetical protein